MSLSTEPDYQDYVVRIHDILAASTLLFPRSVGGDNTKTDLVNQIIQNELPIPQLTVEGPGPPHIFISQSNTPLVSEEQRGRNDINTQGGKLMILEFYIVIIVNAVERQASESLMFNIISAVTTELNKNKRLGVPSTFANPLAIDHSYKPVPYIYDITQNQTTAKNVVLRPQVGVNLR